ncbi:hypothetical protein D3C78_1230070 [compost metagenome]
MRLAGTQPHRIHRQIAILGIVAVGRAQLDQLDPTSNGLLDTSQHHRGFQIIWGDQVLTRQTGRRDDRLVGSRKLVAAQLTPGHPGQWLAFSAMGLAGKRRDLPDIQQHLLVRVVMVNRDQRPCSRDHNPQLFVQFAGQRNLHGFALLDLAAGKLPQSTLMLGISTASDQDLATGITDDGGGYMNSFHRPASSRPAFCQTLKAGHW